MPRFDPADLTAFASVARARGFRAAARVRGVSPSALSEAVRRLESDLGTRLLNRSTRSVAPTEIGRRLLDRLGPVLATLDEAVAEAVGGDERVGGVLRLNVPSAVAQLVLPPILAGFLARHPAIRVEVTADNRFVDVLAAGFDAGVRYSERVEKDMIAIPIGPRSQHFATAAAPAYIDRHGPPTHPRDLLRHACLRYRFASGAMPAWSFAKAGEQLEVVPDGPLVADDIRVQLAVAEAGLGIVHAFSGFLAPSIAAGSLVPLLEDWTEIFSGPILYFSGRRHMPVPLRAFVDYVKEEAS